MDYYDFVASAIAAVASLYNANAELAHLQKIGVKDVCVLWCGSTLQNNNLLLESCFRFANQTKRQPIHSNLLPANAQ